MIASGVPILDALLIVAKSAATRWSRTRHVHPREASPRASTMADPLSETGVFP
jgi:type IV pilus assembly protein PilC